MICPASNISMLINACLFLVEKHNIGDAHSVDVGEMNGYQKNLPPWGGSPP